MRDIALVAPNLVRADGQGRAMLELARVAAAEGHRVTVYAENLEEELQDLVDWRHIAGGGPSQIVYDARFSVRASRALATGRHDVACVMGPCARPPRPFMYYAQFSWRAWRSAWSEIGRPRTYHRVHAATAIGRERRILAAADGAIAVSHAVAAEVEAARGSMVETTIVPNGIDLDEFCPATPSERAAARARFGVGANDIAIAFVGEYNTPRKGLAPLMRAVALGDGRELILAAGDGTLPTVDGARVSALGRVVPVRPVLAAADIVAVPSIYEPFSLVALEAAAMGLPLVLSARAGAADHLDGAAEVVATPADPRGLRAALDRVEHDGDHAAALGRRARAAAEGLAWHRTAREALAALTGVGAREGGAR